MRVLFFLALLVASTFACFGGLGGGGCGGGCAPPPPPCGGGCGGGIAPGPAFAAAPQAYAPVGPANAYVGK